MTPNKQKMIEELKRLDKQANKAPWNWGSEPQPNGLPTIGTACGLLVAQVAHSVRHADQKELAIADASLIVAMRNALPSLLEEVEKGYERGVRDAAKASMNADPDCTIAAILSLLPPAPASDDAREG